MSDMNKQIHKQNKLDVSNIDKECHLEILRRIKGVVSVKVRRQTGTMEN